MGGFNIVLLIVAIYTMALMLATIIYSYRKHTLINTEKKILVAMLLPVLFFSMMVLAKFFAEVL